MADSQELQVQQKRELEKKTEGTTPARVFVPVTDIFETAEALTVVLEMPGVDRNNLEASVEDDVVTIEGRIDFSKYEGMQPVYTEYNVGHGPAAHLRDQARSRCRGSGYIGSGDVPPLRVTPPEITMPC